MFKFFWTNIIDCYVKV